MTMTDVQMTLRPATFARGVVAALAASEGRRRRRARNTTPDKIGLELKRGLLEKIVSDDPEPEAFEQWLVAQVVAAEASGPVRAMCAEIWDEYRFACSDAAYLDWLRRGAPSDDAQVAGQAGTAGRAE